MEPTGGPASPEGASPAPKSVEASPTPEQDQAGPASQEKAPASKEAANQNQGMNLPAVTAPQTVQATQPLPSDPAASSQPDPTTISGPNDASDKDVIEKV